MKKKNVLLVDDEEVLLKMTKTFIEKREDIGKVHLAKSTKEAFSLLNRFGDIDILITDLSLETGNEDGARLANWVIGNYSINTGIIVVTGFSDFALTEIKSGVGDVKVEFLAKPFAKSELYQKIDDLC